MYPAMIGASFDPLTNGHLWMIQQGFKRFELNLAIAVNPEKKYTFTEREREDMLSEALFGALGDRAKEVHIHVIPHLYLARYAESRHCHLLLRGIRNDDDFKYERSIRHANAKLCPDVDTLYMIPPLELEAVSSSFVKGWIGPQGWEKEIIEYVPPVVYYALLAKIMALTTAMASVARWAKAAKLN